MFDDPVKGLAQHLTSPHVDYCKLAGIHSEGCVGSLCGFISYRGLSANERTIKSMGLRVRRASPREKVESGSSVKWLVGYISQIRALQRT